MLQLRFVNEEDKIGRSDSDLGRVENLEALALSVGGGVS